jgi:16S rRNA A1518/A1519 N6-dimethyltransferase RsmA/KsgA/DIM1 with predicted DNA glycosylase/AP lyase activity
MMRLIPSAEHRARVKDLTVFRRVLDGLFGHRRKRAARSLSLAWPEAGSAADWAGRLRAAGLDPEARGEEYSVDEIVRLANNIAASTRPGRSKSRC